MSKPKFNPIVTRIKLNPEQAVLSCACWDLGRYQAVTTNRTDVAGVCALNADPRTLACNRSTRVNAAVS